MRVLQVIPNLAARTGGPPVAVVESSLALRDCGVETTIFATDMAEAASAPSHARVGAADLPAGARDLDLRLFPARWPRRLAFSPELYRSLAREAPRYDVVHIHSLFLFPQFAAYRGARTADVPYVVSPRGALDPFLRGRGRAVKAIADTLWQRGMLDSAAALHVTSDDEQRLIADVAPRVTRHVVPNGIRWNAYQQLPSGDAFRARFFAGSTAPIVMFLGRISHKKGLDVLIRAFARVRREIGGCKLAIVGPDDEGLTPSLRSLAGSLGIAAEVVFTGMLQGDEKLGALAAADVWALPSHSENFGNAVIEAMACGLPVVISPHVNIAPQIASTDAGIVAALDEQAFATAIMALLHDRAARDAIGERGRAFARRYDWSAVGPQLASMYDAVVRRN